MSGVFGVVLLLLVGPLCCPAGVEAGKRKSSRPKRDLIALDGPTDEMIWESGLMEKSCSVATIYEKGRQFYEDTAIKRFQGSVLGYVTPWNRGGYEAAVRFRSKLTHVSPVWYQLKRDAKVTANDGFVLTGGHDVNQTWIKELRMPAKKGAAVPRIVPRVMVELTPKDLVAMLEHQEGPIAALVDEVEQQQFDGLVLEVVMQWVSVNGLANDGFRAAAFHFVKSLAAVLHADTKHKKDLILAVPPVVPQAYNRPFLELEHLQALAPSVDGWSVMTYDYADGQNAAPNSPLTWLQQNLDLLLGPEGAPSSAPAFWMGVNFYGYDFDTKARSSKAITSTDYFKLLSRHQPDLEWEEDPGEHVFRYTAAGGAEHIVYYPTPRSLEVRLEQFQKRGVGVSIWELGQGLERFFDLL